MRALVIVFAFLLLAPVMPAQAQSASWSAEKCRRYGQAWTQAMAKRDRAGLGEAFLAAHAAFLASDCLEHRAVCPRSAQELDLANMLVILGMNRGLSSTFMPFACRG